MAAAIPALSPPTGSCALRDALLPADGPHLWLNVRVHEGRCDWFLCGHSEGSNQREADSLGGVWEGGKGQRPLLEEDLQLGWEDGGG